MTKGKDIRVSLSHRERVTRPNVPVRYGRGVRGYHEQWQPLLVEHLQNSTKPLLVILGPTASGKTAFSLEVAKWIKNALSYGERVRVRGSTNNIQKQEGARPEIINADSRQLYKYMDIGTAKIQEEDMWIDFPKGRGRTRIPHHLFSVLDPKEKVTVGWYKREAEKVINDVLARGNVPILVGGSMLYISAVTDGYVFTGRGGKRRAPVPYDLLIFGLRRPREELVKRIEERTACSLSPRGEPACRQAGVRVRGEGTGERRNWFSEVAWLLAHGYTASDPGMESCGYREIAAWILNGKKEEELPTLMERINTVTRQYAKRQVTWWKHDERIHWICADDVACRP